MRELLMSGVDLVCLEYSTAVWELALLAFFSWACGAIMLVNEPRR